MDIENLSKAQLLLLTLLVNFVVSIATAIVTVSLLEKAPPVLTQTINRIVERTVETVTPGSPGVITHEKTVVVKEDDLVISAVSAAKARTVLLKIDDATTTEAFGTGTFLPRAHSMVTLGNGEDPENLFVVFSDGTTAKASLSRAQGGVELYVFADGAKIPDAPAFAFMPAKNIQPGQTVFAIAGDWSVVTGIVSFANAEKIRTTLSAVPPGSQIVNSSGDVIGLAGTSAGSLLSADSITALLAAPSPTATSTPATGH